MNLRAGGLVEALGQALAPWTEHGGSFLSPPSMVVCIPPIWLLVPELCPL